MATRWFRKDDGREVGPVTFKDLAEMLRAGPCTRTINCAWSTEASGLQPGM